MKKITIIIALLAALCLQFGCAAAQLDKLRKKIPAGHADTLSGNVTTLGGWGGTIAGKNIDSDGRGHISADEYSESVNTPWATYSLNLTGSSIGKKKLQVKPAAETDKPAGAAADDPVK